MNTYDAYAKHVVAKYRNLNKEPMLVVGCNSFLREKMHPGLSQEFDVFILFYPNAERAWVLEAVAFSRTSNAHAPLRVQSGDADAKGALIKALGMLKAKATQEPIETHEKMNTWFTHWIYRCRKIALKDILGLEAYGEPLEIDVTETESIPMPCGRLVSGGKL